MPKTDINTILKKGAKTKFNEVDYSTPENQKRLIELRKECDIIEARKNVNLERLRRFYITT